MSKPTAEQMERRWKKLQKMQGYTDEELEIFRSNPSYVKVVEGAPKFLTHRIIIEVVEAHNCSAGHKAGDKIAIMSGDGVLLPPMMPERVCAFALMVMTPKLYAIWERFYADLDPNAFLRSDCKERAVGGTLQLRDRRLRRSHPGNRGTGTDRLLPGPLDATF